MSHEVGPTGIAEVSLFLHHISKQTQLSAFRSHPTSVLLTFSFGFLEERIYAENTKVSKELEDTISQQFTFLRKWRHGKYIFEESLSASSSTAQGA